MSSAPVLIAYDGSECARAAIHAAGRILKNRNAVVGCVWCQVPTNYYVAGAIAPAMPDLSQELEESAFETAREGVQLADQAGFAATARTICSAPSWSGIVELAEDVDASVIVLGARGLSALKSMLLGSTSNAVLHHADRPVLIISAQESEDES